MTISAITEVRAMEGRTALVTGASSGIGRATALAFAEQGARVALADIDGDGGHETLRLIRERRGDAAFILADVTRAPQVEAMVDEVARIFGGLDCAFNNAGIVGTPSSTVECTEDNWDTVIAVDLKGVFLCMKYEIPSMVKRGRGAIVNMSSIAGLVGLRKNIAYVAGKHGVVGLTRAAALEYAEAGIRINAVCPGFVRTPILKLDTMPGMERRYVAAEPVGRLGRPEEIAAAVVWLCSDAASFVTGHALSVDGGLVAR
jgi:NAD(P)-dependent dehydrogenase (short-subunit alcohol dehydrogenase family)